MPRYSYKAYDAKGARTGGELSAATREGALETLVRRGEYPIDIQESVQAAEVKWWQREVFGSGQLSLETLALFTRELVSLIKADLPIDESLRLVSMQPMIPSRLREIVVNALGRVTEGYALSEALAAQGPAFPEYYWRLVRAGEASGSLAESLEDLAAFLERSAEARGKVISALLYPAVLIVAALAAVGVIMSVLLPAILPIFEEAGVKPPFVIGMLSAAATFIGANWALLLLALAAAIVGLAALLQSRRFRQAAGRFALRLPLLGQIIERRETGRLARTLGTLIRNGVPIVESVRIGASVLSNPAMTEAVREAAQTISEGGQLSGPLARSGLFSDLFLRLAAVGEQTGQLDTMLTRAADIYESALQRQMQRLTSLITPAVTLLIGLVVGGLIMTVMSALMSVNDLAIR
jgi:general secretion pathway protein F